MYTAHPVRTVHPVIERVEALFLAHGHSACYDVGVRQPGVTALEHALQCAQLAEWAEADHTLVAAALLHDIGQFIQLDGLPESLDVAHEARALPLLMTALPPAVTEPIRLHVEAKRYLVSVDARYAERLPPASVYRLALQGGAMDADEARRFEVQPHAREAIQLRLWDDLARRPGKATPPLSYYLRLIARLLADTAPAWRAGALNPI